MKSKLALFVAIAAIGCGGAGTSLNRSALGFIDSGDLFANNRYYDVWTFVPRRSGTFAFEMNSNDFDSYLVLQDEFGNVIEEDDDSGPGRSARISSHLTRDRDYFLIATSFYSNSFGEYEIRWNGDVDLVDVTRVPNIAAKPPVTVKPKQD